MPTSLVEIANLALGEVGEQSLITINDTGTPAGHVRRFIYQTIREVLSRGKWKCARAQATLSQLTAVPLFGWAYAYELPADYIRLVSFNETDTYEQDQELFEIQGRTLLTDEGTASIVYLKDLTIGSGDLGLMPPLLVKACALTLAAKLSWPMQQSATLKERLTLEAIQALREAKATDAVEEFRPVLNPASGSRWLAARSTYSGTSSS